MCVIILYERVRGRDDAYVVELYERDRGSAIEKQGKRGVSGFKVAVK